MCERLSKSEFADELRLVVFPVVLGDGYRLFGELADPQHERLFEARKLGETCRSCRTSGGLTNSSEDDRMISIGVLTPHAAAGPEVELPDMAPGQIVTQVSRVLATGRGSSPETPPTSPSGLRALAVPPALDRATAAFATGSVDVLAYASTSTGYAVGWEAENTMVDRLSQRWSLPVASTSLAAVLALRAVGVHRVALVHPPWFDEELNDLGAAYFRSRDIEVVSSTSADLPNDPTLIEPGAVIDWISSHLSDDAEAVFIGGTGFRAAQAIEALEARLGRPVLESNQVLLWSILATLDSHLEIGGYGALFDQRPSGPDDAAAPARTASNSSEGDEFS